MRPIQDICASIGLTPRTVVECGPAHIGSYRVGYYVANGTKVILIEASPRLHYCLTKGFNWGDFQDSWPNPPPPPYTYPPVTGANVTIINAAVTDQNGGTVKVYERNASTFVGGIQSPARVNDGYTEQEKDLYLVPAISIDTIDDGQIDVLLADVEGCEYLCIKHLVSRPRLIVLEMSGQSYSNPFTAQIHAWMAENGYRELEHDPTDVAWIHD